MILSVAEDPVQATWSVWIQFLHDVLVERATEAGYEFQEVSADAAFPPFPREGPERAGGPAVVPVGRGRRAAPGAAGAVHDTDTEGPGRLELPPGFLAVFEPLREEAVVVVAGRADGARGEPGVPEHAGLVAVLRRRAPVAAVPRTTTTAAAHEAVGRHQRVSGGSWGAVCGVCQKMKNTSTKINKMYA